MRLQPIGNRCIVQRYERPGTEQSRLPRGTALPQDAATGGSARLGLSPAVTAVAMLYEFRQPRFYAYLNHNPIEVFLLGAAAHVNVERAWNDDLMKQVRAPGPIRER